MSYSTASEAYASPDVVDDLPAYRSTSRAAVMSLALAFISLAGLVFASLLVFAVAGMLLALVGLNSIRRYPNEYSGKIPGVLGLVACTSILIGGVIYHSYVYATECPPDATRVSFYELNPEDKNAPAVPTKYAVELHGKKIFIKGYVYPDGQRDNIKQFVLIPDLGTCCFGGQPRLTDMILVTLRDPQRTEYNQRKRKLTGQLKVDANLKPIKGVTGVYYQMDAESIQ
jgi:hypothetical protein